MEVKVGTACVYQRTYGHHSDHVVHEGTATIARITKKRVYLSNGLWFALDDPKMVLHPRYLYYVERVTSLGKVAACP